MSERFPDEVLLKVLGEAAPYSLLTGEYDKALADLAAMRAVLEGHLADKIVLNAPEGKCPECRHSVENHHTNCPIGRIAASKPVQLQPRLRLDRLQHAIDAIEMLFATRGWSDGFRERLRQILDEVKASDGSHK